MRSARAAAVFFLVTWSWAAVVAAQVPSPTGNVYGTAQDTQGSALIGVAVTLTGPGAAQTAKTDAKGDFRFLDLSPGDYAVTLERNGLGAVRRNVLVVLGKSAVLSITMAVADVAEAITVVGDASALDSRKIETGAIFGQAELRSIPTTRDPWTILRQVPGVLVANMNVGGGQSAQQSVFVGKGEHSDQNLYNLDGVTISIGGITPLYFDFDSLDSIAITTGGSDPSLATAGVTLNLVTKRGTHRLLGSARALYTGGARWDYGVEAGGPLWRDRVWLWGAGARNAFPGQTFVLRTGESSASQETQDYWNAKLNADPAAGNSITLSYLNFERFADGRGASRERSQASTWNQTFPGSSYKAEDSQVLSERLFASLYVSYLSGGSKNTPKGGVDVQADYVDGAWRNSYVAVRKSYPNHQAGATLSSFFDTGPLRHELKFGFGYRIFHFDSMSSWPGDQLVGYAHGDADNLAAVTRPQNSKIQDTFYDAYLGDTVQAGRLTLIVGARFDYETGKNLPSTVPANPVLPGLLPAVSYGGESGGYAVTWRLLEPRLGATYALGRERKTLLRASYARFAAQLGLEAGTVSAFPGIASLYYSWNDANHNRRVEPGELGSELQGYVNVDPTNPASSAPVNQIARDLKPRTTEEVTVGIEREISSDLAASLAYTHRSVRGLEFSPLIGTSRGSYQYLGNASGTVSDAGSGLVLNFSEPYYGLASCPAPCAGTILENRPDSTETYSGLDLQLVKRLSHGWMLRVGFAYNDWRQRVGAAGIVDPNNLVGGTNRSGAVVESGINAKWQFNVSGVVQLPLGIEVGANFFGRQGFPVLYNVQVFTHDVNPSSNPILQIGSVGAYRLPNVYELDLHLEKALPIGPRITASLLLDVFNLANSKTVLDRDASVGFFDALASPAFTPNEGFNAGDEFLSTRTFRGGLRIAF